jgi:predicted alpha/beta hydrolase
MVAEGQQHGLRTADGWELKVTAFEPSQAMPGRPVVLIFPAMGAPARIYHELAAHLAARGSPAVAIDPRGVGQSLPRPSRAIDYAVDDHLERDWPAVIGWARLRYPGRSLALMGHSLGGHLSAIYAGLNPDHVQALVLLSASHVHYRNWDFPERLGVRATFAAFALLARALGYFPGQHLGWGGPIARGIVLDWARWGASGKYQGTAGADLDAALARVEAPVLAISFTDDHRFGPIRAVDRFTEALAGAPITRWHLAPEELGRDRVGHFGHLKDFPDLWDRIDAWLAEQVGCVV